MVAARIWYNGATTVTTGATKIFASNVDVEMRAISAGAGTLFIGGPGVTTTNGIVMAASSTVFFSGGDDRHSGVPNGDIYGIVTTGTNACRTSEVL